MNKVAQIARKQICDIMSQEMELPASQVDSILFASLGSLRLSSSGNAEMKKVFDHYTFQPEKEIKDLKSYHFVAMNRLFDYPFYIGKKNIVLYSSEDSVAVNLYGGMDEFLEALSSSCKLDNQRK